MFLRLHRSPVQKRVCRNPSSMYRRQMLLGLHGCVHDVGRAALHASGCAHVVCCVLTVRPHGCTGRTCVSCAHTVVPCKAHART
eukprot:202630-Alexandrium_andersonii.AAC.1